MPIAVAVPLNLAFVLFYPHNHGKQKILGVLQVNAFGVSHAPTGLAGHIGRAVNALIISGITALSGLFG